MNRIQKITFKTDYLCYKAGWSFEPRPGINLIVGDQGCGKSTLLKLLATNNTEKVDISLENDKLINTYYLDTEKHNPRMVSHLDMTHVGTGMVLHSRFMSHGETILPIVASCEQGKDSIFFFDEPESGLSIRSQYAVNRAITAAEKNGCQLLIATHSWILMNCQSKVFSLEHNAWMRPNEFLETQKKNWE